MTDLSAKEAAAIIGTDPKSLRRFMREYVKRNGGNVGEDTPGRGGRYVIDEDSVDALAEAYRAWRSSRGAVRFTLIEDADEDV